MLTVHHTRDRNELRWQRGCPTASGEGTATPTTPGASGGKQRLSFSPALPWAAQHRIASPSGIPARRSLGKGFGGSVPAPRPTARGQHPGAPVSLRGAPRPSLPRRAAVELRGSRHPAGAQRGNPARAGRVPRMTRPGSGERGAPGARCLLPGGGTPGSPSRRRPHRDPPCDFLAPSWSSRPLLAVSLHHLALSLEFPASSFPVRCALLARFLHTPRCPFALSIQSVPLHSNSLHLPARSCPFTVPGWVREVTGSPMRVRPRLRHALALPPRDGTGRRWHLPTSSPASHQHRTMVPAVCPGQRRDRRRCPRSSAGRGARRCSHGPPPALRCPRRRHPGFSPQASCSARALRREKGGRKEQKYIF